MDTILFVSGEKTYSYKVIEDALGGDQVDRLFRYESVEVVPSRVAEPGQPHPERSRPTLLWDAQHAMMLN